ncbi:acyl-CoA dehydrogenase family protein [Nonomuraea spiralis]|uniref:acyl-CoA dehydrogenase family protein n=1 Tax=Nonomuraea spiralis TaxID=46182 RepID=UPI00379D1528
MDFNLDETQQDLKKLTAEVLTREEAGAGGAADAGLWQAGLMGVCVPEEAGGAGLGPVEMAVVLRETGARAAAVPALPVLVSTLALARHGTPGQWRRVTRATLARREPGRAPADPPATAARPDGDGWSLTGRKVSVPYPADDVLVTADQGLFLVSSPPVSHEFTSTGEPAGTIVLDGTPAERVGGPEAAADAGLIFTVAVAAQASGVLAGALDLTTSYIRTRRQFGRALAEFQAVTMQIADVYIAGRALDVAMWSAAWRLAEGLPADEDVALAAFHVCEAVKALYTCQHLHGGLGLDVTYPLHRYFAQAKHLSHLLGGADAQLDLIGALA